MNDLLNALRVVAVPLPTSTCPRCANGHDLWLEAIGGRVDLVHGADCGHRVTLGRVSDLPPASPLALELVLAG